MPSEVSEYGGRTMTLGELLDARQAVETWANGAYHFSDPKLYGDICHLCTLAQGMWYNSRKED